MFVQSWWRELPNSWHWSRDVINAVLQITFSNAFCGIKNFLLKFHQNMLIGVQVKISYHWFRWCIGPEQKKDHYQKQILLNLLTHICDELKCFPCSPATQTRLSKAIEVFNVYGDIPWMLYVRPLVCATVNHSLHATIVCTGFVFDTVTELWPFLCLGGI